MNKERELYEKARASTAGFGELFDAYYQRIYAYAFRRVGTRQAAEDIAACVFEDALRGIKRVRWQNKPLIVWLYTIAARRVADHHRSHREAAPLSDQLQNGQEGPDEIAENSEESRELAAALEKLSDRDREIIRLTFFEDLDSMELTTLYRCSKNSVYVRLHRALRRLRGILEEV